MRFRVQWAGRVFSRELTSAAKHPMGHAHGASDPATRLRHCRAPRMLPGGSGSTNRPGFAGRAIRATA